MRWIRWRRKAAEQEQPALPGSDPLCLHTALVPKWDRPADVGHDDQVARFVCDACGTVFTPHEARALRATEAERLRHMTT